MSSDLRTNRTRTPLTFSLWIEVGAAVLGGLELKTVATVEDSGEDEPAQPFEGRVRLNGGDSGLEGHGFATRGLEAIGQPLAYGNLALRGGDERIPVGVFIDVGEDVPHRLWGSLDVDFCVEFVLHFPVLEAHAITAWSRPRPVPYGQNLSVGEKAV